VTAPPGRARRFGYRVLGSRLDYVLHLRPAEWPVMAAHTALGYLVAVGFDGAARGVAGGPALLGLMLWVVCLNGGTLAINSAVDRDEGDVAYLRRPPPPPSRLLTFGLGLMLAGFVAALALPSGYAIAYAICVVMSVCYSLPPIRLKSVAGADWLINMVGFGTLTPYAGWASTGRPLDLAHGVLLAAFCPLFASLYPLTQLYQLDEDTRRGDRTLAVRLGPARSLDVALVAAAIAFGLFIASGLLLGWGRSDGGRWLALALAALAWSGVLIPWRRAARARTPAAHQRAMYWALGAWAVTDLAVAASWGT
jgi:lycopene elongase/hydratase (dihydrobisanhydrobacterioruberin-forming)